MENTCSYTVCPRTNLALINNALFLLKGDLLTNGWKKHNLVAKVLISVNHKESFKILKLQKVGMVLF